MSINSRLQFFSKIFKRSTELHKTAEEWAAIWAKEGKSAREADGSVIAVEGLHDGHKPFEEREPYTTERLQKEIRLSKTQSAEATDANIATRVEVINKGGKRFERRTPSGEIEVVYTTGESKWMERTVATATPVTVTFSASHGTVTPSTYTGYVDDKVQVSVAPNEGYHFTQWSDGNTQNPRIFNVPGTTTLTATLAPNVYTLEFSSAEHGTVSATVDGTAVTSPAQVPFGSTVVLSTTPEAGYALKEFVDEAGIVYVDDPYSFSMPAHNKTFTAEFEVFVSDPLKFTSTGDSTVKFQAYGSIDWPIETSLDGSSWSEYTIGTSISLSDGQYVYFRGIHNGGGGEYKYRKFIVTGHLDASGDVTSLLNKVGGVKNLAPYGEYVFTHLFDDAYPLYSAPYLPAISGLTKGCYSYMFKGCYSISSVSFTLPATTLTQSCYSNMFNGCSGLTSLPEGFTLPATTLTQSCYSYMFCGCTKLVTIVNSLPAQTLVNYCYQSMFKACTHLTGPISISATTAPITNYTSNMFNNAGTARPATPTDYNKIKVGGNVSDWNSTNAGINTSNWTVELIQ